MSTLKVNNVITQDNEADLVFQTNNTTQMILTSAGTLSGAGATPHTLSNFTGTGKLVQVIHTKVTAESFNTANTSDTDITGLAATITPTSTSNKIRITVMVTWGGTSNNTPGFGLKRAGTQIGSSTNASGSQRNAIIQGHTAGDENNVDSKYVYIDDPQTTSATAYQATVSSRSGQTFYLNRSYDNVTTKQQCVKTISSITVEEISM